MLFCLELELEFDNVQRYLLAARLVQDYSGSAVAPTRARISSARKARSTPAMFGPNLHGDAVAGGATKIDLEN